MGKSKKAPEYATTTAGTGGLFGSSVTSKSGTDFTPTDFQRNFVNTAQTGMQNALSEYLNPNYNTDAFKQSDSYYKNKMYNTLQNDYLNTALSNNLMRGSTATDTMRGFAKDLANTEYERQQDYKNQQLQKLQAALLGYNTIYDMSKGVTGLSNALAQSVSNYNASNYQASKQAQSALYNSIGQSLGAAAGAFGAVKGSDKRLKENLKKLDTVDGVNIYEFNYIGDNARQVGVIAQELQNAYSQCVIKNYKNSGYLGVDYSKLPLSVQSRIEELKNNAK
ncbi:MAG: tail fiber domain-containing protein [Candidatus Gastranaerophilales bacterium]|nr:tail fiber domain-containing protein [Candidatus Gastranaerophilales bacterium]